MEFSRSRQDLRGNLLEFSSGYPRDFLRCYLKGADSDIRVPTRIGRRNIGDKLGTLANHSTTGEEGATRNTTKRGGSRGIGFGLESAAAGDIPKCSRFCSQGIRVVEAHRIFGSLNGTVQNGRVKFFGSADGL